jgi:ligand-binding sensor domain-containing protein/DNA-binding CsgD family transcriptional regulator
VKRIAIVILLLTLQNGVRGQNTIGLPLIVNYNKAEFHGGAQTWDIGQDKNGYMYFANNEGLLSFDGIYWKVYPLPNRTIMRSLAIDNQRVYAGGQGEIGYFEPDGSGFLRYTSLVDLLPADGRKFADVWDIQVLEGGVFFRTTDRIFELRNNSIRVYPPQSQWQFMAVGGRGLFAQDRDNGLLRYRNGQWAPLQNNGLLRGQIVSGIISMGGDSLIVSTTNRGSFLIHNDSLYRWQLYRDVGLPGTVIFKTTHLNADEFVAATTAEGCLIMNFAGKLVQSLSRREGLQNNTVLCSYVDRDGNLWTGLNNGISLIAYNAAIKYIRPNMENELAGFSTRVYHNALYIGSSDGAFVAELSPGQKDLSFSKGVFNLIRNSGGQVWRLDEVNQQLVMGHNLGTFVLRDGAAEPVSPEASWTFLPLSPVVPSRYVVAGTYTGLKVLDFSAGQFSDLGDPKGNYESYRYLAMDNNNIIWASHPYRGVYQLRLAADRKTFTNRLFTSKDGLPSDLNNFVFNVDNRIVFATVKGAYEWDGVAQRFVPSSFLTPVFGQMELRYLHEDADGNIWFVSGKRLGVAALTGRRYEITWFPEVTGEILSGFENVYPYNNENVFVSSEKGIIHLNYEKYIHSQVDMTVLLSTVRIPGNPDSTIAGGYYQRSAPRLPARFNSYHFEFSTPNYGLHKNIEFSYKLDGDDDWSAWSRRTEKDYTNLADGQYVFRVKARDNLGNESEVATYTFFINPPFYKTVWAWSVYVLLFFLLIYGVRRAQARKLRRQLQKFEEQQARIIALHNLQIEKSEKEIIKLQNENLAQEVLLKKKELADASMHLVEREDALSRVKDELKKLYKKTGNNHDVKSALQLLHGVEKNSSNWDQFASHFNEVSNDFLKKLKTRYPMLTNSDLKVCAYLQLNLSSKEIAQLMNISVRGVEMSRYRVRKKLNLPQEQSLSEFLNGVE